MIRFFVLVCYVACVPAANYLIGHVGTCVPHGPCLVPVGFGLMAPSGVLMIGLALVLRDVVQLTMGVRVALAAVLSGAAVSALIAPPALAIASGAAFLASEVIDTAVYTPLAKRRFLTALVASSVVGLAIDSALFLWLAFGSLQFMAGQLVGKLWMVALAVPVVAMVRRTRKPASAAPPTTKETT